MVESRMSYILFALMASCSWAKYNGWSLLLHYTVSEALSAHGSLRTVNLPFGKGVKVYLSGVTVPNSPLNFVPTYRIIGLTVVETGEDLMFSDEQRQIACVQTRHPDLPLLLVEV